MKEIATRIEGLRAAMRARRLQACIIPSSDYHGSEYLCAHFRARAYFSGFTGSAGTLVVLPGEAFLWTDGRYFLQAARELEGSGVALMRMGEEGVPEIGPFLAERLKEGDTVGFDGRMLDARSVRAYLSLFSSKGIGVDSAADLVTPLWTERPALPQERIWLLDERFAGESAQSKLGRLRAAMEKEGAEVWALGDCEDIAWLLNIRGGDMPHTPVPLCFCFVEREKVVLCMDADKRDAACEEALLALGVEFRPYEGVLGYADRYGEGATVMLNAARINYALWECLNRDAIVIEAPDLIAGGRIVKNETQIRHIKEAHRKDGAALLRFLYWIKNNAGAPGVDEYVAGRRMDALRAAVPGSLGPSFDTICACGPNAAVVHYCAKEKDAAAIEKKGLLLVDSGGHYREGTTDVTRTVALGEVSPAQKRHFTLVLKGMLALMHARFPADTEGGQLDALARAPIWQAGLDYRHGTGHGVGFLLGVHEDPVRIRHKNGGFRFDAGMVVSDEPGIYIENSHGIRLENLLLCVEDGEGAYGRFLRFETLTLAPIDLEAIEPALLTGEERDQLNAYHARVYEALAPFFREEADAPLLAFLREATRAI